LRSGPAQPFQATIPKSGHLSREAIAVTKAEPATFMQDAGAEESLVIDFTSVDPERINQS
jgi:hypothetical protein